MALLNDLSKKITKTGQDVLKGTKDFTEVTRLNAAISDEQKQITQLFTQLGKLFYDTYGLNGEGQFLSICTAVSAAEERINAHRDNIATIKGVRACPNCGAEVPSASSFCGSCGKPIEPIVQRTACRNCGEVLADGAAFCTSCGTRTE